MVLWKCADCSEQCDTFLAQRKVLAEDTTLALAPQRAGAPLNVTNAWTSCAMQALHRLRTMLPLVRPAQRALPNACPAARSRMVSTSNEIHQVLAGAARALSAANAASVAHTFLTRSCAVTCGANSLPAVVEATLPVLVAPGFVPLSSELAGRRRTLRLPRTLQSGLRREDAHIYNPSLMGNVQPFSAATAPCCGVFGNAPASCSAWRWLVDGHWPWHCREFSSLLQIRKRMRAVGVRTFALAAAIQNESTQGSKHYNKE